MRSFWMAAVGAVALVGCASGQANQPVSPQPPPSTTHEAQPVSQVAPTERGESTPAPQASAGVQTAPPESQAQTAPPQAPPETGSTATPPSPTAQPGAATPPGGGMGMNMQAVCPMTLPGTKVKAEDTSGGASLVFTTTSKNVSALRERVQKLADWHNQHSAQMRSRMGGAAPGGTMKGTPSSGGGMPPALMSARAHVQHIRNGAQLIFTPADPAQLTALRSEVRQHAQRMESGQCGMGSMGGMHGAGGMGGMNRPPPPAPAPGTPPPSNP